ncbi:hypothetical protein FHR83_003277 [Actinoplanes campanulatus]|uniref:Uncharacterized protein n=1 Tax=Actinoplanes campanulatus TaxID=113559 RepID=A0A7W5FES3_9ACTN|nr:hypothetical protein [Actinoplanes campanulatus]MBB3095607.1 hypothetical protein [Actinoplanes campanulatus]GGN10199.1 hypothetical protein GCM10010109_19830 [Actinoplanes campanulatus]GID36501.1 hypothetical protein Aca09nite_30070 [Actinoplanes campanulatus]
MSAKNPENSRWAPWWVYVVIIAGANYGKQHYAEDLPIPVNAAITIALVTTLFLAITAVYRGLRRPD